MAARTRRPSLRPGPAERIAARLLTGPAGHLVAGVADFATLAVTLARRRVRRATTGRSGTLR